MAFRFVHTADVHLDSPLVSLALRDPALAAEVGVASRTALTRIVDLCLAQSVDALVIAGDLWDGSQTSAKTPRFLKQELTRLSDAGIRSFILRGNHDAASKISKELVPPPLCHVFGTKPTTEQFEAGGHSIAVHGVSFAEGAVPESLLPRYPAPVAGAFNLGMMHTSLNGTAGHDVYAPCSIGDLDAHGYDYWALGHIHKRAECRGRATVVMPGIPQGRDIGEAGATSVTLATLGDDGRLALEQHTVAALRFDRLRIDLTGADDWAQAISALTGAIRRAGGQPRAEDHLVLRPHLTGTTPLAFRLARDLDQLHQEAVACAEAMPGLWIDKVENTTNTTNTAEMRLPADLVALVTADLPDDPALMAALADLATTLLQDLPPELRDLLGHDDTALRAECASLLAEGTADLLSRLTLAESA
ncbi:metallophosphoesterase family protein [Pseudotabrizicola sp. L79]|uniref:metallophosphoesterase family protein n=1 Tax=Pseudotabrizicola sp. L79 TaxID=3118402 RepID=UPI002F93515D